MVEHQIAEPSAAESAARVVRRSPRPARALLVGPADDPAEREADIVADLALAAIRRGGAPAGFEPPPDGPWPTRVRRSLDVGGMGPDGGTVDRATASRIRRSAGRPLDAPVRAEMEAGFGTDLSHVRIHRSAEAAALSQELGATAFTLGSDVFFGAGSFAPGTSDGRRLLAHELAHTVQQSAMVERHVDTLHRWLDDTLLGREQPVRKGLIHGSYRAEDNSADLHVDKKQGPGPGLPPAHMREVAEDLLDVMTRRHGAGGPVGTFILHPTGAAIVKTVVELLAGALGGYYSMARAAIAQRGRRKVEAAARQAAAQRKAELDAARDEANRLRLAEGQEALPEPPSADEEEAKSADRLDASVIAEHIWFLEAMRGDDTVKIVPQLPKRGPWLDLEGDVVAELTQDMMAKTPAGNARFAKYTAFLEDEYEQGGASLDVTITHRQLPAIIKLLASRG